MTKLYTWWGSALKLPRIVCLYLSFLSPLSLSLLILFLQSLNISLSLPDKDTLGWSSPCQDLGSLKIQGCGTMWHNLWTELCTHLPVTDCQGLRISLTLTFEVQQQQKQQQQQWQCQQQDNNQDNNSHNDNSNNIDNNLRWTPFLLLPTVVPTTQSPSLLLHQVIWSRYDDL